MRLSGLGQKNEEGCQIKTSLQRTVFFVIHDESASMLDDGWKKKQCWCRELSMPILWKRDEIVQRNSLKRLESQKMTGCGM